MFDSERNFAGDYSRELLRNGIIELKAGNRDGARRYLDRALYMSSDHALMAEVWYWMSELSDDPGEKREALENCLANDLQHARARRALAVLNGQLKPDEIVNPDALPSASDGPQSVQAQRFMCPKCGGRMTFSPDGQSLVCEYCVRSQRLNAADGPASAGRDFVIAMATARGHDRPLAEQVFHCQGCDARFILPPGQLSATCAYCGSPHVVQVEKSTDLLAPDGILPHAFDQRHATDILVDWVEALKIEPERKVAQPRGLYLPLWTFDFGGGLDYTAEVMSDEGLAATGHTPKFVRITDRYPVMLGNIPIPASRKPSAPFVQLLSTFDLRGLQPYDPRYLVDWPAELYDVSMADASLDAREQVVARFRRELPNQLAMSHLISLLSTNLTIDSFRLILLPVWMTEIWCEGRSGLVLVNGQNGAVQGDVVQKRPSSKSGVREWLADLVKE